MSPVPTFYDHMEWIILLIEMIVPIPIRQSTWVIDPISDLGEVELRSLRSIEELSHIATLIHYYPL